MDQCGKYKYKYKCCFVHIRRETFLTFQINSRQTTPKFVRVSFKYNRPAITGHCWISKSLLDLLSPLPLSPRDYLCRSNIFLCKDKFVNNMSKKCYTSGRYITQNTASVQYMKHVDQDKHFSLCHLFLLNLLPL